MSKNAAENMALIAKAKRLKRPLKGRPAEVESMKPFKTGRDTRVDPAHADFCAVMADCIAHAGDRKWQLGLHDVRVVRS